MLDGRSPPRRSAHPGRDPHTARDHEFNASYFAARVAVATVADLHSAVVAAIAREGAASRWRQRGRARHAPRDREPRSRRAFVERGSARGRRSQAGSRQSQDAHARLRSPRLQGGRRAGAGAARDGQVHWRKPPGGKLFEVAERLYDAMKARPACRQRGLLPPRWSTTRSYPARFLHVHLRGRRVAGWCAHIMEQYADNPPDPPASDYIGRRPIAAERPPHLTLPLPSGGEGFDHPLPSGERAG